MKRWSVLTALLLILLCSQVSADESTQSQFCFQGKPRESCRLFLLAETGIGTNITSGSETYFPTDHGLNFVFGDYGVMMNRWDDYAVGATTYLAFETDYDNFRAGFKLWLRRWLRHDFSVNLASGLLLFGGNYDEKKPSFAGHLDVNYRDWIALYVAMDQMDETNVHTGIKVGSYPGVVAAGVAGVIAVVAGLILMAAG
jgi:hypothetical protein